MLLKGDNEWVLLSAAEGLFAFFEPNGIWNLSVDQDRQIAFGHLHLPVVNEYIPLCE